MKMFLLAVISILSLFSSGQSYKFIQGARAILTSTILHTNVHKTKGVLTIKKVYSNGSPAVDQREFAIVPNGTPPAVTLTRVTVKTTGNVFATPDCPNGTPPATNAIPANTVKTTTTTTIPPGNTITSVVETTPVAAVPAGTTIESSTQGLNWLKENI